MRVAFYGNVCNILYQIVKAVRSCSDVDAHLFVNTSDHMQMLPESDDPEVLADKPEWIHRGAFLPRGWYLAPWTSSLVQQLQNFDLVVAGDVGPMIAQFAGKPLVLCATGGDLTAYPFPLRFLYLYSSLKDRVGVLLKGYWQRRALRKAREVWVTPFYPFLNAVRDLRIEDHAPTGMYFPFPIDIHKIMPRQTPLAVPPELQFSNHTPAPFLIFHPTRIQIDDYSARGAQGQGKNNVMLFQGLGEFVKRHPTLNVRLVLIERDTCMDVPTAKRWLDQANLTRHVIWLKPPRSAGFTRNELVDLYSLCHVVADQFSDVGWFGNVALEGCACSRPVITRIDNGILSRLYSWHPFLPASSPADIATQLLKLYTDTEERKIRGAQGRRWIEEYHSLEATGPVYATRLRHLAQA